MAGGLKKRGQKLARKMTRASIKASEGGREHIRENFIQRIAHIKNIRLLIFEWVLLVAALTMLALAQAVWSGESYAMDAYVEGGTYTEATVGRVNSMNPLFATTSSEKVLSKLMFARLVSVDYSGHPGPQLAETVRVNEDGRVWTLKLREGLLWSDGEALTNEDVLFTLSLVQNAAVNTIYSANLEGVKVVENENGEIEFTLAASYADFLSALEIPIVPKHVLEDVPAKNLVEAAFSNMPVGSGAFMFNATQATATEDEKVFYLSANPNYYLGKPMLSNFAVHTYGSREEVVAAVNAGAVTGTAELSGVDAERVVAGGYARRETPVNAGAFAFFNTSSGVLSNAAMRRAIRQGIDLKAVWEAAPGTEGIDYPILESQITLGARAEIPGYDLTIARATVEELSGGAEIHLNIATVTNGYLPAVAEALAAQLRALGIECEVTVYAENQDFVANVVARRNYDILVYEIELGADPDPLAYYHSSQASTAGLNLSNYRNALVDDLLIAARGTLDSTLRARKYETFLEYWVGDAPAVGLYRANLTYVYNKNVRAYGEEVRLVTGLDRFSDIRNWAVNRGMKNKTP